MNNITPMLANKIMLLAIYSIAMSDCVAMTHRSIDTIPMFAEMYSYEDIDLVEYDFVRVRNDGGDTIKWGKKQFIIESKQVTSDSAIIHFTLNIFDLIDSSVTNTTGAFRIYNEEHNGYPELSKITEQHNGMPAHLGCSSNLSEWFEIDECRLDYARVGGNMAVDTKFGRLLKSGDGALAYSASLIEGLGYNSFELSGSQFEYVLESLVGYVTSTDTIGVVSDPEQILAAVPLDNQTTNIELFPNPASNKISIAPYDTSMEIIFMDYAARQFDLEVSKAGSVDVSLLKSGIYYAQILDTFLGYYSVRRFIRI